MSELATASWTSLRIGEGPPPRTNILVTITDVVRYQGVSGDLHPAHHDIGYASAHGYPRLLSLGMLHASSLAAFATDWLGPENVRSMRVRFREAVWVNDKVSYTGKVLRKYMEGSQRMVEVELLCLSSSGASAIEMTAAFSVP